MWTDELNCWKYEVTFDTSEEYNFSHLFSVLPVLATSPDEPLNLTQVTLWDLEVDPSARIGMVG